MDQEELKRLNEIRKYLEISKDEFKTIVLLALKYQKENEISINEEKVYEIIEETLNNVDYCHENYGIDTIRSKTLEEAFNKAIVNLGYQKVKKYQ